MEMLCNHCNKRQATKTREERTDGEKKVGYYCADCYHALFLSADDAKPSPSECPYCGKSKESVLRSGLVGCAYCYQVFAKELVPVIIQAQGGRAHVGESPALTKMERLQKRYEELQVLLRESTAAEDIEKVKQYSKESLRIKTLMAGRK